MKRIWILAALVVPGAVAAQAPELAPLEEVTWSLRANVDDSTEVPIAVALSARGKRLNVDYDEIEVSEASVYDNPISVCVATIRAGIQMNESWWGQLAAPWGARDGNGVPLSTYVADSGQNLYRAFTYHIEDPSIGRMTDATVKAYLRVGRLHAFDVAWTEDVGGTSTTGLRFMMAFEEGTGGLSGKFRFAPEWMSPMDPIKDVLTNTDPEDQDLEAYRVAVGSRSHSIQLFGLYGGNGNSYPLTLRFRGGIPTSSPHYANIEAFRSGFQAAISLVPKDVSAFATSDARVLFSQLVSPDGLQALDEMDYIGRIHNPFREPFAFVIESPDYVLAFGRDDSSNDITREYRIVRRLRFHFHAALTWFSLGLFKSILCCMNFARIGTGELSARK